MWDTVLLVGMVTRWPWEIDDNEGGIVGFLNDELVQLDRGVHSTKIIVMSARMREGEREVRSHYWQWKASKAIEV